MKKALFCIFLAGVATFFGCQHDKSTDTTLSAPESLSSHPADTLAEITKSLQLQSRLYTTECHIHKMVLFSDEATIGGRLLDVPLPGYRKAAIPIDVTLKAYIDFSDFSSNQVILSDSLCVITLPDPQVIVTSSRIDHEGTRQYVSTLRSKFSDDELSRLATKGEDSIISHLSQYGIEEKARLSCARTLIPVLTHMGFKDSQVILRFRKKFTDSELRPISDSQK